jgi:hypothetical protein
MNLLCGLPQLAINSINDQISIAKLSQRKFNGARGFHAGSDQTVFSAVFYRNPGLLPEGQSFPSGGKNDPGTPFDG